VGLAVDDFGTGYSSLEAFAASSFDALKVDQSFVRDVTVNPRHRAIVRTIIGFAQDLGLLLTAEGIETEEQRQLLLELGCAFGQGNLFAPAMPALEFEQRL
jgi:EAL domain-containing protein (putative c-di-GMP-specific phosphodiesterase class I)